MGGIKSLFPAKDLEATKAFFAKVFGWSFVDYGPEHIAFSNEGLDGGFFQSTLSATSENGSALIVFYSNDLGGTLSKVKNAGGRWGNYKTNICFPWW
ncbi:VOC family protein [Desulfobacula sp.]|uniref:VOC family protein n=1 Tax=Desulfobacula sp. TaxID=2593537 RepID=UPI00271556D4|nr:VOC family protein [Desulfobacula sp.]